MSFFLTKFLAIFLIVVFQVTPLPRRLCMKTIILENYQISLEGAGSRRMVGGSSGTHPIT